MFNLKMKKKGIKIVKFDPYKHRKQLRNDLRKKVVLMMFIP